MSQKIKKKFIEDQIFTDISDDIAQAKSDVEGALEAGDYETIKALSDALAEEVAFRVGGDAALQAQFDELDAEYAKDADIAALQADVDQNEADGDADRALIRGEFAAADTTLQSNIDAEATARSNADTGLQSNIDANSSAITAEETRAMAAESANATAISAEVSRATAAEQALGVRIDDMISNVDPAALDSFTEVVAAYEAADGNLQTSITNLSTAAAEDRELIRSQFAAADSGLQSNIDALDAAYKAADSGLQSNIDAEAEARITADSALQAADDYLQTQINDINNNTDVQDELDATQAGAGLEADGSYVPGSGAHLVNAASLKDADDKLSDAIDQEISDRIAAVIVEKTRAEGEEAAIRSEFAAADSGLQSNIDALDAAYKAADQSVRDDFAAADSGLQSNIDAEVSRATAAEQALGVRIDDMISNVDPAALDSFTEVVAAYEAADGNLQTSITNLSTAAAEDRELIRSQFAAADSGLQSNIDALDAAYKAADSALDGRVTTLEGQVADLEAVNVVWIKEKFVLGTDATEAGGVWSVALSHEPVSGSESVFVGRLAMHDEDYSMSGQQVSFDGAALVDGGDQDLVSGDVVYVKYQYQA